MEVLKVKKRVKIYVELTAWNGKNRMANIVLMFFEVNIGCADNFLRYFS